MAWMTVKEEVMTKPPSCAKVSCVLMNNTHVNFSEKLNDYLRKSIFKNNFVYNFFFFLFLFGIQTSVYCPIMADAPIQDSA